MTLATSNAPRLSKPGRSALSPTTTASRQPRPCRPQSRTSTGIAQPPEEPRQALPALLRPTSPPCARTPRNNTDKTVYSPGWHWHDIC
ncbi:hypothetical protein Hsc_4360 [Herbaspirillum seropedicae]|nr:hypothetical protein Hsc_4360 [Herbaspirillum seropedicae]